VPSTAVLVLALLAAGPTAQLAGRSAERNAEPLAFGELFVASARELRPSPRLQALAGHRVRLTGFMVKMEDPPRGAFYLAPRPVDCDESGAGTGDLPPEVVRVVVRSSPEEVLPWVPRPLEVTGVLELGPQPDGAGRVSAIRIVLDRPGAEEPDSSQPGAGRPRTPTK
jgi:hypothetical protein